jgi:hypothetical protein
MFGISGVRGGFGEADSGKALRQSCRLEAFLEWHGAGLGSSWGRPGPFWGHFWLSWDRPGSVLWPSGGVLGPLGPSWAVRGRPGPPWGHLGADLGRSGAVGWQEIQPTGGSNIVSPDLGALARYRVLVGMGECALENECQRCHCHPH